jgi:hypothetical protein
MNSRPGVCVAILRFTGFALLFTVVAQPCSVAIFRKVWAKKPGSKSRLFAFERDGKVGFIDPTGKVVVAPTIDARIEQVGDFSNGLARVGNKGFLDESGKWVIRGDYFWTNDFSDGLALVSVLNGDPKEGPLRLYLDTTGEIRANTSQGWSGDFSDGLAPLEEKGKPGIRKFEPGNFIYKDYPGLKGFIDRNGQVAIKATFAEVGPFVGGLARATPDGYCHMVIPDGWDQGTPTTGVTSSCGGFPADATSICPVGFIDRTGTFAIQPRFESARDFQEDLAAVGIGGLWTFIDTNGATIGAPRFEEAKSFREGLAAVKLRGRWGFVDRTGNFAIVAQFEQVEPFSDSLAIAYKDKKAFYIDRQGATKISGPFREATPFVQGLAAVLLTDQDVAYINKAGKTVFKYVRSKAP